MTDVSKVEGAIPLRRYLTSATMLWNVVENCPSVLLTPFAMTSYPLRTVGTLWWSRYEVVNIIRQFNNAFQSVTARREIKKKLRSILWIKYQIKDNEVFEKAYSYIEMYY